MSRLFTFGDSFTRYRWPTWADILARQYKEYYNWGRRGSGNHLIFNSVIEASKRHKFTKNDTVFIMWSSIAREDRYINNDWLVSGSIYSKTSTVYNDAWIEKFADPAGFLIRDLAYVSAVKDLIENIGCRFSMMSIVPLPLYDHRYEKFFNPERSITDLYTSELQSIKPSVYEIVYNKDWFSRPGLVDWDNCKRNYDLYKGDSWPKTWPELLDIFYYKTKPNVYGKKIEKEILIDMDYQKNFTRCDYHPIPMEHLEYLDQVGLGTGITQETRTWVKDINNWLLDLSTCNASIPGWQESKTPKRL